MLQEFIALNRAEIIRRCKDKDFCRWAVEANDGRIYARSLPDTGCVFTIDLPRHRVLAAASVSSGVHAD